MVVQVQGGACVFVGAVRERPKAAHRSILYRSVCVRSIVSAALDTNRAVATALDGVAMVAVAAIGVGLTASDVVVVQRSIAPRGVALHITTLLWVAVAPLITAVGGEAALNGGTNGAAVATGVCG